VADYLRRCCGVQPLGQWVLRRVIPISRSPTSHINFIAIFISGIERPAFVCLHDAVLHHFFLGARRIRIRREFVYNYGGWSEIVREICGEAGCVRLPIPQYFGYPSAAARRGTTLCGDIRWHNPRAAEIVT